MLPLRASGAAVDITDITIIMPPLGAIEAATVTDIIITATMVAIITEAIATADGASNAVVHSWVVDRAATATCRKAVIRAADCHRLRRAALGAGEAGNRGASRQPGNTR